MLAPGTLSKKNCFLTIRLYEKMYLVPEELEEFPRSNHVYGLTFPRYEVSVAAGLVFDLAPEDARHFVFKHSRSFLCGDLILL